MKMLVEDLSLLRLAVGGTGEDRSLAWWRSGFCGEMAEAYLAPVFPKSVMLSVLSGVTGAACRVHDEHIGVGKVFHLFRLPEAYERAIAESVGHLPTSRLKEIKSSVAAAKDFLRVFSAGDTSSAEGPTSVGKSDELSHPSIWKRVAAIYLRASESGTQAFPYFVEK